MVETVYPYPTRRKLLVRVGHQGLQALKQLALGTRCRNGYGPGETLVGHTRSGWPMKRTLKSCKSTDNHHFQQLLHPFTENEYDFCVTI